MYLRAHLEAENNYSTTSFDLYVEFVENEIADDERVGDVALWPKYEEEASVLLKMNKFTL